MPSIATPRPGDPRWPHGWFIGDVVAVWNPDGRSMTLREPFAYMTASGKQWDAPTGSVVDGASIPRFMWTAIGGPFEGHYRHASVVHDVACVERSEPWKDVHRMFYSAMLAGGVAELKAKLMYTAVYHGGPRWPALEVVFGISGRTVIEVPPAERTLSEEEIRDLQRIIATSDVVSETRAPIEQWSIEDIEQFVPAERR